MRLHPVVRDVALVVIAVSAGWWLRGAGTTVLAGSNSSSSSSRGSDAGLEFQLSAGGPHVVADGVQPGKSHALRLSAGGAGQLQHKLRVQPYGG